MEKTQLCSMFASLDADLVELALNASGGNVELALNALLVYAEKQENAAQTSNQTATVGGEIEVDVINNARARVKLTFKYEQKVQDVIEAIKQQEGWGSNGRLFHNYSNGAFYIITNLSQDPSLPLSRVPGWEHSANLQWHQADESAFTFRIKTLKGTEFPMWGVPNETVLGVKEDVCFIGGQPPDQQRLIYAGKQVDDTSTLSEVNISEGARVHLVGRIYGD